MHFHYNINITFIYYYIFYISHICRYINKIFILIEIDLNLD